VLLAVFGRVLEGGTVERDRTLLVSVCDAVRGSDVGRDFALAEHGRSVFGGEVVAVPRADVVAGVAPLALPVVGLEIHRPRAVTVLGRRL
jgi:hypothetical protein